MTNFEYLQSASLDELAAWLDKYSQYESTPWQKWFDDTYCNRCASIECQYAEAKEKFGLDSPLRTFKCAYCELEGKCQFFPDMEDVPSSKDIINMWLRKEVDK